MVLKKHRSHWKNQTKTNVFHFVRVYLFERERQLFAAHRAVGHAAGSRVLLQLQPLLQRRPGGRRTLRTSLPLLPEIDFRAFNLRKTSCGHCLVLTGTIRFVSLADSCRARGGEKNSLSEGSSLGSNSHLHVRHLWKKKKMKK